jgi:predicted phosphoribosyltransferase
VIVLALPRGGVPVGYEVARALGAPLDVFLVRKLGVHGYEELAMGAVATAGVRVLNDQLVERLGIPEQMIEAVTSSTSALISSERLRAPRLERAIGVIYRPDTERQSTTSGRIFAKAFPGE